MRRKQGRPPSSKKENMKYVQRQQQRQAKRIRRVRAKLFGTAERPRVTVHRSNQHILVQAVNDAAGTTLAAGSDLGKENKLTGTKSERAVAVAKKLAQACKKQDYQG